MNRSAWIHNLRSQILSSPDKRYFVLVRGVSGSGKTHVMKQLKRELGNHNITLSAFAADDFFGADYDFDPKLLGKAHAWCLGQVMDAFADKARVVGLHNTCTEPWEYENYIRAARLAGYEVELVRLEVRTRQQLEECARRNNHNVPLSVIAQQWVRMAFDGETELVFEMGRHRLALQGKDEPQ